MNIQVIIFSVLLSNSVFSAVCLNDAPNQKHIHQFYHAGDDSVKNFKSSLPQFNVPDSLSHQHLYQQNNKPVKPPLNVVQNRPLPVGEGIQMNHKPNFQQKNLRVNNFLTNRINVRNSELQQNVQSHITKPFESRHLILSKPHDTLVREIPYRRVVDIKEAATPMVHKAVPGITKIDVTNVPERGPVKQQYKTNLASIYNINNVSHSGNNNNNINQQKNLPIQQSVTNKRYIFIRKNGVIEIYNNLEELLKKYPLVKLPPNVRQVLPSQIAGLNKDFKTTGNIRTSLPSKPYSNINIPIHQNNNDIAVQNGLQHPTNFQQQSLKNKAKIPDKIKDDTHVSFSNAVKSKVNHNTRNNITEKSIIDIIHAQNNLSDKIKPSSNQGLKVKTNLNEVKQVQNKIYTPRTAILLDQTERVNEKSVTNLLSTNMPNQVKSAVLTASEVNKFGKPINSTVDTEINTDSKENRTIEATTLDHNNSSLDSKSESINKLNPNTTAIDLDLFPIQKMAKKQFETNITYIEGGLSTSAITSSVTKPQTTFNSFEQKEIYKIADQTTFGHEYKDNNEDSWSPKKPVMWFTTNDPNFWDKLVDDSANNYVYIINVQSHPKIEKDTKTVVHANGTIVEEITESIWENDFDDPRITKTVKITPSADITKDKIIDKR